MNVYINLTKKMLSCWIILPAFFYEFSTTCVFLHIWVALNQFYFRVLSEDIAVNFALALLILTNILSIFFKIKRRPLISPALSYWSWKKFCRPWPEISWLRNKLGNFKMLSVLLTVTMTESSLPKNWDQYFAKLDKIRQKQNYR